MKISMTTFLIFLVFISFAAAQEKTDTRKWYQDPRMMNIGPGDALTTKMPNSENRLNYINKNTSVMVRNTTGGSAFVYPNFRVHPSTTTQSETPIVTHPTNKNIMYGSSNAAKLGTSIFFNEGVYVTTDGGTNWFGSDTTKAAPIADHGGDPAPSIDANGRFYQSYLSYSDAGLWVSNSTDYGATWAAATKIITGSQDKNHTFSINNPSSPYNGRTFVIWSRFTASYPPVAASFTTDNGTTWSGYTDINVPDANHYSQGCNGAFAPNGDIYVTWQNPIGASPYTGDYVGFAKSTDGGSTWTYNNNIYDCNGIRGNIKTAKIRVNDFPWMAVDKSGGTRNGWIYIVTAEKNLSPAGSDPDIILHSSTDGGTTWSAGIRVNQDELNNGKDQYMPCVVVDGTGGVNIVYYDNRNTTADSTQVYISRSIDGGSTWYDLQVSDHTFKPVPISGTASGYQGDYIGITEGPNSTLWPYWADNISGIYQAWITKVVFETYPLNAYNLNLPASGTTVTSISQGTGITNFTWDTSASTATYKWTFGSPTIATPRLAFNINTNLLSFNSNQLDTLLAALGMNQGDSLVGQWSVMAYRNNLPVNDSLQVANGPRDITLKRGKPQLVAFDLNSPGENAAIITSIFNYTSLVFNWRRSGDGVKYRLKFGQALISPQLDFPSGSGGYDTTWSTSNNELDQMLQNIGLATGDSIQGIWAVYSYSGSDSLKSVQSYNLKLKRKAKGEFLVAYDSTQTNGIASKDSVTNNLFLMNRTYDVFNKGGNISTNVISFRGYKYLIWLGESSSVMSNVQKDSVKAYLNSGGINGASKSKFIVFSEDVGYELDRPLSTYQDTAFSKGMLGFEYIADRPAIGAGSKMLIGDAINSGIPDSTVGPWPDVLKTSWLGGKRLYAYSSIYLADTGCGIGRIGTKWNTAIFGTDIRALRSAYNSPAGSPVARILTGVLYWVDEAPTPVELTSFSATASDNSVCLNWTTATEINNSGFSVERKSGINNFMKVGFIKGKGTTTEMSSYSFNDKNLNPGTYSYRLKQMDLDGKVNYSNEVNIDITVPSVFSLEQNYPNPFNPGTSIRYSIPQNGLVSLAIFNILGEKVLSLENQNMKAGKYEVKFDASHYASGIYFYKLEAGQFTQIKKMILLK
jgi:hypothetical protein